MSASNYEPSGLNRFWLGFLLGLFLPLALFLLYFLFGFSKLTFSHFVEMLLQTKTLVFIFSLAVFPNILPFMFFMRTNRIKSGQGLMTITILFVVSLFVLKFFLP